MKQTRQSAFNQCIKNPTAAIDLLTLPGGEENALIVANWSGEGEITHERK